jgi:hypothetical protein
MTTDKHTETTETVIDYMEPTAVAETDKERGINQPGISQGISYTDSNGNKRHKFETLSTLKPETIRNLMPNSDEGTKNEKVEETTKQKENDTVNEKSKSVDTESDAGQSQQESEPTDTVEVKSKPETKKKK